MAERDGKSIPRDKVDEIVAPVPTLSPAGTKPANTTARRYTVIIERA